MLNFLNEFAICTNIFFKASKFRIFLRISKLRIFKVPKQFEVLTSNVKASNFQNFKKIPSFKVNFKTLNSFESMNLRSCQK